MPSLRTGRLRLRLRDEQEPARGPPPLLSTPPATAQDARFPPLASCDRGSACVVPVGRSPPCSSAPRSRASPRPTRRS
ncbi:MAG: hypothetical protein EXR72_27295 [Myxococcales bacterium]|nr:hypothetical protein [Myxococcales bacterium]